MHGCKFDLNMYVYMIPISYCDYQYGVTNVYRVTARVHVEIAQFQQISSFFLRSKVIDHYCNYFNVWI